MGIVLVDISISLDGFIARHDDSSGPIHEWFFAGDQPLAESPMLSPVGEDADVVRETLASSGAVIAGRRTYDFVNGWDGNQPMGVPVVVVTHEPPADVPQGPTPFTFADSIDRAVASARQAAGDADVVVMGGATVIAHALRAKLVDEVQLHVAPVLLGDGIPLAAADLGAGAEIALEPLRVVRGPHATHLRYRVA